VRPLYSPDFLLIDGSWRSPKESGRVREKWPIIIRFSNYCDLDVCGRVSRRCHSSRFSSIAGPSGAIGRFFSADQIIFTPVLSEDTPTCLSESCVDRTIRNRTGDKDYEDDLSQDLWPVLSCQNHPRKLQEESPPVSSEG
jgi:hypothetical protein